MSNCMTLSQQMSRCTAVNTVMNSLHQSWSYGGIRNTPAVAATLSLTR